MLIGLGEPFLDPKIFDRIEYCERHGISTLLSTNGTLLDEEASARLLDTPLEHITLSFDGATKESFEFYRKGARFEKVRDNFVRFARMKQERGSKMQVVVQMVRMERNAGEVDDFIRFWSAVPGIDQVRIKEDETNLMRPDAGHASNEWKHPCHYLWRGPMYVKHNGDVYPCCQSYMLDGKPLGNVGAEPLDAIFNGEEMQRMRQSARRAGAPERSTSAPAAAPPFPHPALVAGIPRISRPHRAPPVAGGRTRGLLLEAAILEVAEPAKRKTSSPARSGRAGSDSDNEGLAVTDRSLSRPRIP